MRVVCGMELKEMQSGITRSSPDNNSGMSHPNQTIELVLRRS